MKNKFEHILSDDEIKHRIKLAGEVALVGIAIWKLRAKIMHYSEDADSSSLNPIFIPPISVTDGDREVFVYPDKNGFSTGIKDPEEGLMGIAVKDYGERENGESYVEVDTEVSELDPKKLEMIRSSLERVRDRFRNQGQNEQ